MAKFQHPIPGWLTLHEAARNLGVEPEILERMVAAGSVRYERAVVLGEVIVRIPFSEVFRLEEKVERARRSAEPGAEPARSQPERRRALEQREQEFADREALLALRILALEAAARAAQAKHEQVVQELARREEEQRLLLEERARLVATVAGLEQIRDELGRLAQRSSSDERLRAARAELASYRERLERAEALVAQQGRLERITREAHAELRTNRATIEAQTREIAMLRTIEHNNERYIERLERRLSERQGGHGGQAGPGDRPERGRRETPT